VTASHAYVLFTIEDCRCALPVQSVSEVLPFPDLFRPPGTPRVIAGFLDLGGQAIAVVDAAVLLDPASSRKPIREQADLHLLLLAATGRAPVALAVQRVLDVATIRTMQTSAETEARLPQEASSLRFWHEGDVVHLLSVDGLLRLEERVRLGELTAQAQARLSAWEEAQ
jgi:purine-binding chemotaxis protein CheW